MKRNSDARKMVEFLIDNPQGVHRKKIMRECCINSESSFYEILSIARKKAQIEALKNGTYRLVSANDDDEPKSVLLPDDDELMALFAIKHILNSMTSDILKELFAPLQKRFLSILNTMVKEPDTLESQIRILDIHHRTIEKGVFSLLMMAIARKRAITFKYTDSEGKISCRVVSPHQLVRYKDNWYLGAWCHNAGKPRIFSLDMITNVHYKNTVYHAVDSATLQEVYATSYGIFSGKPTATAQINFTGKAARYVKREQWHPKQKLIDIDNSTVQLRVPYSKPTELICMILYWGKEAEVIAPAQLRDEIAEMTKNMAEKYVKK